MLRIQFLASPVMSAPSRRCSVTARNACGASRPLRFGDGDLTIDHVLPKVKGGPAWPENEVVACYKCNHRRGAAMPLHFLQECEDRGLEPNRDAIIGCLFVSTARSRNEEAAVVGVRSSSISCAALGLSDHQYGVLSPLFLVPDAIVGLAQKGKKCYNQNSGSSDPRAAVHPLPLNTSVIYSGSSRSAPVRNRL